MPYFLTPHHSVAFNAKVASSTLARAIIAAFHPAEEIAIQAAAYPADLGPNTVMWHSVCPKEREPSKPVVLIVREPIARFRTAMAQVGLTDADAALTALEQDGTIKPRRREIQLRNDVHFRHQHELLRGGTAFRLEDLGEAAAYIGLSLPLPQINEARRPKPDLTPEREARVLAYYADDATLYASL
jgi:hypothetical protein